MNTRKITALTVFAFVGLACSTAWAGGSVSTTMEMETEDGRRIVFEGVLKDQGYPTGINPHVQTPGSICVAEVFDGRGWIQVWSRGHAYDYAFDDRYEYDFVGEWCGFYDMFNNYLNGTIN